VRETRLKLRLWHARSPRHRQILAGLGAAAGLLAVAASVAAPWHSPLSATTAHADSRFDDALFSLFNQDRAGQGLPALQSSPQLSALAETTTYTGCGYSIPGRAEDMVARNYFSHTILNCGSRTVFDIMRADGIAFSSAGENLGYASGVSDPVAAAQWVNSQFMQSPEHAGNILDPNFNTVGIGSWWTASGQTWSGAGGAQSNVIVTAAELIQSPAPPPPATTRAPSPTAPPRPSTTTTAHAAPRVTTPAASTLRVVAPAMAVPPAAAPPDTGVVMEVADGDAPGLHGQDPSASDATRVSARVGNDAGTPSLRLDVVWGVGAVAMLASIRRWTSRGRRADARGAQPPVA